MFSFVGFSFSLCSRLCSAIFITTVSFFLEYLKFLYVVTYFINSQKTANMKSWKILIFEWNLLKTVISPRSDSKDVCHQLIACSYVLIYQGRKRLCDFKCVIVHSFCLLEAEMEVAQGKWEASTLLLSKGSLVTHLPDSNSYWRKCLSGMRVTRCILFSRFVDKSNKN